MDAYKRHYSYNVLGIVLFVGLLSLFFATEDYSLTGAVSYDSEQGSVNENNQLYCNNLRLDIVETYNRINELIKQGKRYDAELQRLYVRMIEWSESCIVQDTDGDKLDDWIEREITGTNINKPDTDAGGKTDGEEVLKIPGVRDREGPTNPLDPKDDTPQQTSYIEPQITPYPIKIDEDKCMPETQMLLAAKGNPQDIEVRLETEQGQLISSAKASNNKGRLTAIIPKTCGIMLIPNSQLIMIILKANIEIARRTLDTQILPEPMPPTGGDSWSFIPRYQPGEKIYEGPIQVEEQKDTLEQIKEFVKLPFEIIIRLFNIASTPLPGEEINIPEPSSLTTSARCGNVNVDRTWNEDFGRWEGEQCDPPGGRCSKQFNLQPTERYPEGVFTICDDKCQCSINPLDERGYIIKFPFGSTEPFCGDKTINQANEECDPKDTAEGSNQCREFFNFYYPGTSPPGSLVYPQERTARCDISTCTCESDYIEQTDVECGCSSNDEMFCSFKNKRGAVKATKNLGLVDLFGEFNSDKFRLYNCGCKDETKIIQEEDVSIVETSKIKDVARQLFKIQKTPCAQETILRLECHPGQYLIGDECCPIGTVLTTNNECVQETTQLPPSLTPPQQTQTTPQQPPTVPQQPPTQPPATTCDVNNDPCQGQNPNEVGFPMINGICTKYPQEYQKPCQWNEKGDPLNPPCINIFDVQACGICSQRCYAVVEAEYLPPE